MALVNTGQEVEIQRMGSNISRKSWTHNRQMNVSLIELQSGAHLWKPELSEMVLSLGQNLKKLSSRCPKSQYKVCVWSMSPPQAC